MKWGNNDDNGDRFIDSETKEFTRGKYVGYFLEDVFDFDVSYLIFLVEESTIDDVSKNLVEDFLENEGIL